MSSDYWQLYDRFGLLHWSWDSHNLTPTYIKGSYLFPAVLILVTAAFWPSQAYWWQLCCISGCLVGRFALFAVLWEVVALAATHYCQFISFLIYFLFLEATGT